MGKNSIKPQSNSPAKGAKAQQKSVNVPIEKKEAEADVEEELDDDLGEVEVDVQDDEGSDEEGSGDSEADSEDSEDSEADSDKQLEDAPESEDDSDIPDDIPKKKKRKLDEDGSQAFTNAFNSIMGSKLKAYKRKAPIMARNKSVQKQLESEKLELKAKRELLSERKQLHDKHRVKNLLPTGESDNVRQVIENEKRLKKVAQKGVVRLFNAVLSTQVRSTQAINKEQAGQVKKQELFNEMSKEKFLDLVQSAGKS